MKKTSFYNALSNYELIDSIKKGGNLNLILNIICTAVLFGLYNMKIDTYKLYFVLVSCIVIYIDFLVGLIVVKLIKTKHKTLLFLSTIKYVLFTYSFLLLTIVANFTYKNDLKIHIIFFVFINIIFIPINYKALKDQKHLKESKFSIIAGSLIPVSGIVGMCLSRFFRSTGNESITLIMLFYLATFLTIIMQKIFIASIWQYRNYEKVYTKELVENWIRLEKKRGEDDPKRSYY